MDESLMTVMVATMEDQMDQLVLQARFRGI